jgi:hypothetical protein
MNKEENLDVPFLFALALLIFLAVAVVLPNFFRSRRHTAMEACIANMKQLEGAREQALLAGHTPITSNILGGTSVYIKATPVSPISETAHVDPASSEPTWLKDCPGRPVYGGDTEYVHSIYK